MLNSTDWFAGAIDELTHTIVAMSPSEWAEEFRRLPSGQALPGPYDYAVTPYLREIIDCMDVRSPVREIVIMKGAQTGGTVGVAENAIGYYVSHVMTAPMMLFTATKELAALRMDEFITPMMEQSGLGHLIQANTENRRKAGQTARKMSWRGGGFLVPTSASEPQAFRSVSARVVIGDEVDAWPLRVGNDGDPVALLDGRMISFSKSKKKLLISTPTTDEQSRIAKEFRDGDQRVYKLPCLGCGEADELRWRWDDLQSKKTGGVVWALTDEGNVEPGSVAYACRHCGFCHTNEHKRDWLAMGEWVPTAIPKHPSIRSYHITGLLSPADFFSWEDAVKQWLAAWNVETNKPRDVGKLQTFYNNVLGEPFKTSGARLTLVKVAAHMRAYQSGEIPQAFAETMCGGKIGFLTLTADVQKNDISAAVYAHGPSRVAFLVERVVFEGPTDDPFDMGGPWGKLAGLIDKKYHDGIDREYHIQTTLVDSSAFTQTVYSFCGQYDSGVYPIKGDELIQKNGTVREFARLKDVSKIAGDGWRVNVNHYKSRLAQVLRSLPRPDVEPALVDSVSFPSDINVDALKEMTAEQLIQTKGKWEWRRMRARNELWDLTVYSQAARDITAYMVCREMFQGDKVIWSEFWPWVEDTRFGWAEVAPVASK